MRWFREGPSPLQTALAMIGVKPGDRVLMLGAGDGAIAGEIGRITGVNGRAMVIDPGDAAQTRVERGAARAGALVEFERASTAMLPVEPATFDIVVLNYQLSGATDGPRLWVGGEAIRVLRPGGRVVCLEPGSRRGLLSLVRSDTPRITDEGLLQVLSASGFTALRVLGDAEGTLYAEGRKG